MDNLNKVINNSFLLALKKIIELYPMIGLTNYSNSHSHSYSLVKYHSNNNNKAFIESNFFNNSSNFTLYYTNSDLEDPNKSKKIISFSIDDNVQQLFFSIWFKCLDPIYYQELFSIAGKTISLSNRLTALSDDLNLFVLQLSSKKKNIVKICENEEFQKILLAVDNHLKEPSIKEKTLLLFCKNNTNLFKRIEIQSIFTKYIEQSFSKNDNYKDILINFKDFIILETPSYFESIFPVYFFQLNKKRLFSKLYHPQLTNKSQLIVFMESLHRFFKEKDVLKQCLLESVYLNDIEAVVPYFTWTFHANTNNSTIDYKELLTYLINEGIFHIQNPGNQNKNFQRILQHYFLSTKLKIKDDTVITKAHKI